MIRITIGLFVALLLSLGFNIAQWRWSIIDEAEREAQLEAAYNSGVTVGLRDALSQSADLARGAEEQRALLEEQWTAALARAAQQADAYERRLRAIPPLPIGCGPGQARVEAFNAWEAPQ